MLKFGILKCINNMNRNQFLILTGADGERIFVNIDNITHVKSERIETAIYVIGDKNPILVKETMRELERLLPDMIQISEVS